MMSRTPGVPTPASGGNRRDPHGRIASRSFPDVRAAGKSDGARVDVHGGGWASTVEEDLPTLSEDRLRDGSPSRLAGMSVVAETRCREQACELLRVVARRLRLPLPPTVAALTILLRFYQRRAHDECSAQFVVPTCLFVASKLEEVPRRISDIVNVTHRVLYPWRGDVVELLRVLPPVPIDPSVSSKSSSKPDALGGWFFPNLHVRLADQRRATPYDRAMRVRGGRRPAKTARLTGGTDGDGDGDAGRAAGTMGKKNGDGETIGARQALADDTDRVVRDYDDDDATPTGTLTCLTGEPYYRVKEIVLELEAEALAAIAHRLDIPQPHRILLNLCAVAGVPPGCAQLATSALTDACFRTTMLLRVRAGDMAAGALRCASAVYHRGGVDDECDWTRRLRGDGGWWRELGFDAVVVEKAADEMLGVMLTSDSTPPPVVVASRGEG